jgi:hypothetical protein
LLVAFLVTVVLVAVVATLAISRGTPNSHSADREPSAPEITFRSAEPVAREFPQNHSNWELQIKATAEFFDHRFNNPAYLTALTNLDVTRISTDPQIKRSKPWMEVRWINTGAGRLPDSAPGIVSDQGRVVSTGEIDSTADTASGDLTAGASLQFTVGPLLVSKTLSDVKWRTISRPGRYPYQLAMVEAQIKLPTPTWAFIRSARILSTETPGKSILQVFVENMSGREVAVNELTLSMVQNMSNVACLQASPSVPITIIHLDWKRIVSIGENTEQATIGWTKINESRIPITGTFQELARECSGVPPNFTASVPIEYVIPSSKVLNISFQIDEVTGSRNSPASKAGPGAPAKDDPQARALAELVLPSRKAPPPSDLRSWDHVLVGFGKNDEVYPRRIQVDIPSKQ